MLGTPQEFQGNGKEAHILYRVIFREAPEDVLEHLLLTSYPRIVGLGIVMFGVYCG